MGPKAREEERRQITVARSLFNFIFFLLYGPSPNRDLTRRMLGLSSFGPRPRPGRRRRIAVCSTSTGHAVNYDLALGPALDLGPVPALDSDFGLNLDAVGRGIVYGHIIRGRGTPPVSIPPRSVRRRSTGRDVTARTLPKRRNAGEKKQGSGDVEQFAGNSERQSFVRCTWGVNLVPLKVLAGRVTTNAGQVRIEVMKCFLDRLHKYWPFEYTYVDAVQSRVSSSVSSHRPTTAAVRSQRAQLLIYAVQLFRRLSDFSGAKRRSI
ncbi:hypothetical protein EVAR_92877_1 [Eumeta japonica]|uniref:Uncharacterized protein n=1 Tax=Eumeta variegata TaxID=151549 RepID=A0A4C1TA22_EUMVA|nr:hypothetical protein EVAR_92877_1 [Eumeta japonica]